MKRDYELYLQHDLQDAAGLRRTSYNPTLLSTLDVGFFVEDDQYELSLSDYDEKLMAVLMG